MILKDTKKHLCGCVSERQGAAWILKDYYEAHEPKWSKKADKVYRRIHKKTGRGYTKSPKKLNDR